MTKALYNAPGTFRAYVNSHPRAQFVISTDLLEESSCINVLVVVNKLLPPVIGTTVARYSRDRDCKRALKGLGYVQEGRVWRKRRSDEHHNVVNEPEAAHS